MDQAEQLRNMIKSQNMQQHMARVITVTSGKGGVGKSSISVNLAIQLSRLNKRVVIIDADFGLANVEIMLGVRPRYNLSDMLFGGKTIREIISMGPENIGFISGGSGLKEMANMNRDQLQAMLSVMYELDSIADVIIIDTGAGISDAVIDMVLASSEILLVATPEPASITDAYALLKTLSKNPRFDSKKSRIKMIANRTQSTSEGRELYDKLNSVVDKFLNMEMDYLGAVAFDFYLSKSVMQQKPVSIAYPNAPSARSLSDIAIQLENGKKMQSESDNKGISGFFSRMFRRSN